MTMAKKTRPRGRQVGWRKPDRYTASIMTRLPKKSHAWLKAKGKKAKITVSEVVRQLIERAMQSRKL